jgi:beta-lactamase class A
MLPVILAIVLGTANSAWADTTSETAAYAKLFDPHRTEYASLFTSQFLAQVPEAKIREIVKMYAGPLGAFQSAVGSGGDFTLIFEKGQAPSKLYLDSSGRISSLWFGAWTLNDDTPDKIRGVFSRIPGTVSVCVVKDGSQVVFSLNPDIPLGISSAFKLYILKALTNRVAQGEAAWEQVTGLKAELMSLPSGSLQTWPAGTPVTLATLAAMMISVSDNTAADTLLAYLGRSSVEAAAPARMRPFLSTLEMFRLKWGTPEKDRQTYIKASADERAKILDGLGPADRKAIVPQAAPMYIDSLEWLATTSELCQTIYELKDSPYIAINPGLVDPSAWSLVGFKGGSEPGVLNLTHVLRKAASGSVYAVSATVNNPAKEVDTQAFTSAVSRLIGLIGKAIF